MHRVRTGADDVHAAAYAGRWVDQPVPKFELPGTRDERRRRLPPLPRRAEPGWQPRAQPGVVRHAPGWSREAERLSIETLGKNNVDQDEYPQTNAIHERS